MRKGGRGGEGRGWFIRDWCVINSLCLQTSTLLFIENKKLRNLDNIKHLKFSKHEDNESSDTGVKISYIISS